MIEGYNPLALVTHDALSAGTPTADGQAPVNLVVTLNWFEELKQRVPLK